MLIKMVNKEDVLKIVQMRGPIIPNELKKIIKAGDTILLGAILSELKSEGKIKITNTKIGGSPAYYTLGTEARLENLIKYLNEKDRKTTELLRQKKILKDTEQSPLVRVSLRNIKDFAKPLEVSVKGKKEIYWKWYMLSVKEAQEIIMQQVKPEKKVETPAPKPIPKPAPQPIPKPELVKEETVESSSKAAESKAKLQKPEKKEVKKEIKKEEEKSEKKEEKEKKDTKEVKEEVQKELVLDQETLEQEKDPFFRKVYYYLRENDIEIIEYKIVRKKSDIDLTVAVPSRIGSQEYYCKAKKKKKINDGDLSSSYVQGQAKKLPVLFITLGDMTKKAKEMLKKDFKGMTVKKI